LFDDNTAIAVPSVAEVEALRIVTASKLPTVVLNRILLVVVVNLLALATFFSMAALSKKGYNVVLGLKSIAVNRTPIERMNGITETSMILSPIDCVILSETTLDAIPSLV